MSHVSVPHPHYYYAPVPPPRTNGLAVAAFVLGLCGFALLPVIFGHVALGQIRSRGESGTAFAIVGLVLGYLEIAAIAFLVVAVILGIVVPLSLGSW